MQKLPLVEKLNRYYAPFLLHILAFESFDFSNYDIVLSISARFAHGVITKPKTKHICYMNSPGRMFWEPEGYFKNLDDRKERKFRFLSPFLSHLRVWDYTAAQRVDYFIANSKLPHKRIKKYYSRNSYVIYPFVKTEKFKHIEPKQGKYFLIISRLVRWKKIDIAVKACTELQLPLKIIGEGSDLARLKKMVGSTVEFLGYVDEDEKLDILANCKAIINTQYEDFGIVPLEAMATGKPVIAYGSGGVLETVIPGKTGEFFYKQDAQTLINLLKIFDENRYSALDCRNQARNFDRSVFDKNIKQFVNAVYLEGVKSI